MRQDTTWQPYHESGRCLGVPGPQRDRVHLLRRHLRGAVQTPQEARGTLPRQQAQEREHQGEEGRNTG